MSGYLAKQLPDVNNLRTFGCDAYVHLPDGQRKNDGLRAKKGILIGYDEESLGYIFYDPRSQGITITGHVSFNEDLSTKQPKTAAQQLEYDALQEAFNSLEGCSTRINSAHRSRHRSIGHANAPDSTGSQCGFST